MAQIAVRIAQGCSGRLAIASPSDGQACATEFANPAETRGKARFKACPTPPTIAPNWTTVSNSIANHHHTSQCAPKRGPGRSSSAANVGFPEEMA